MPIVLDVNGVPIYDPGTGAFFDSPGIVSPPYVSIDPGLASIAVATGGAALTPNLAPPTAGLAPALIGGFTPAYWQQLAAAQAIPATLPGGYAPGYAPPHTSMIPPTLKIAGIPAMGEGTLLPLLAKAAALGAAGSIGGDIVGWLKRNWKSILTDLGLAAATAVVTHWLDGSGPKPTKSNLRMMGHKVRRHHRRVSIGANPRVKTLIRVSKIVDRNTKAMYNRFRHAGLIHMPGRTRYSRGRARSRRR
jgi:hypothetical protein